MKNFKRFAALFIAAVLVLLQTGFAQNSCDNCRKPMVDLYGIKMNVPMPPPDDSLGEYTTTQSQQAFLNWLSLGDAMVAMAQIKDNDPDKDCIHWLDGTMAQELAANPDTTVKVHLENYSTGDLPPDGKVDGVDFVIWGEIDSSGGQYQVSVYLEDACQRTRLATGQESFSDPNNALTECASAAAQIEPVIDYVRNFQKSMRNKPGVAIDAKLDVIPSKGEMNGNETIAVSFNLHDCDGTPLGNNYIKISATNGHFDHDSVETDAGGNATANFTADNVHNVANITAIFYPYETPTCNTTGTWGDTTVNIAYIPVKNWVVNINENHSQTHLIQNQDAQSYGYSNEIISSTAEVTQYVVGDFQDSSISIDYVAGAKGSSNLWGIKKLVSYSPGVLNNDTYTESAEVAPSEDFTSSIGLDDFLQYGEYGGIGFTS